MKPIYNIAALVLRVRKNDLQGMEILYHQMVGEMLTLSFRITGRIEDAEDIIQESFLTSFQNIHQLNDPAHYKSWLKKIVVNNSLKLVKQKIHFTKIEALGEWPEENDNNGYKAISFEKINEAINKLPEGCRQIFTLYLLEDYKHREIAELLNIAVSTSKSQYQYALKLMKAELKKLKIP